MEQAIRQKAIRKDNPTASRILKTVIYVLLVALAVFTLIPFVWMISSSLKLDREVFSYPMKWIPETFHWENYTVIWQKETVSGKKQQCQIRPSGLPEASG